MTEMDVAYWKAKADKYRWISVKDRLPELFTQVLVYDAFEKNITLGLYGNGDWLFSKHITHWMPLPDPPKE